MYVDRCLIVAVVFYSIMVDMFLVVAVVFGTSAQKRPVIQSQS